ncbi:CHAT domain-containing protein [Kibdelosporangium banguiense]|uniref:CHAT domain-containing protein n=1 Tax=Kibdelosporangium banguiense TaxID=1365924 RepID=A0ABS4U276_9PSEU|nr:CHAT domain-containing protein [Kibdelosporangium banguiense]MBP2330763.1 CHAT domain-containing protein [Kibdelosporangium banguiense]
MTRITLRLDAGTGSGRRRQHVPGPGEPLIGPLRTLPSLFWSSSTISGIDPNRSRPLIALRARLNALGDTDLTEFLSTQVTADAEALLGYLATPDGVDVEVQHLLGMTHFVRAAAQNEQDGQEDWARCMVLLWPLCLENPKSVPDLVITTFEQAAGQPMPPEGEERAHMYAEAMGDLGLLLCTLHERGNPHAGNAAVQVLRGVVAALPPDRPTRAVALCGYGFALMDQLQDETDPARFDELITVFREAFEKTGEDDYVRAATGLALSLRAKALLGQDDQLLAEAVEKFRTAVAAAEGNEQRPALLAELGHSLVIWASIHTEPQPDMLREAIVAQREAREQLWQLNPVLLCQFGLGLIEAHEAGVAEADLNEAVTLLEEAVAGFLEGSAEQEEAAAILFRAVAARTTAQSIARQTPAQRALDDVFTAALPGGPTAGDPDNLIASMHRIVGTAPGGGQSRHEQAMDLMATVLRYPHEADLTEVMAKAMHVLEQQVEHLDEADRAEAMQRILDQPEPEPVRNVDPAELAEITELLDRVQQHGPADEDDIDRTMLRLTQLGLKLVTLDRTDPAGGAATLQEVMQTLPQLLNDARIPVRSVEAMTALGGAMLSPFEALAKTERNVRIFRERFAADGGVEARKALALALFTHFDLTHDDDVFHEAVEHARAVVGQTSPPDLRTVNMWAHSAMSRAHRGASTGGGSVAEMASNNAAQSIAQNDGPGALEGIEDGRAMMLSNAFNTRRELDNLRRADPELAEEFIVVRQRATDFYQPGAPPPAAEDIEKWRALSAEWTVLSERVKALPDFDRFLMPLPMGATDLQPAAAEGPVVTINVNPRRCDAIVLSTSGTRLVALPGLNADDLQERSERFHSALSDAEARETVLQETLGWLWDVIAEPVLTKLALPQGSRLWWSPTGPLNFLPLHAAGRDSESAFDHVVSSYTPTIRALMYSRSGTVSPWRSALAVAMPETPGHAPLPATQADAEALASRIPGPPPLIGPEATRSAVLYALPHVNIAHFACHAGSDPADPSASYLQLQDGPLDVATIARMRLENAELAYLSACATARGGVRFANEAVHIASAFQLAGFSQVIATLWEINDGVAAAAAAGVHQELSSALTEQTRLPGAVALHKITRQMRDAWPSTPSAWAGYVHAGA